MEPIFKDGLLPAVLQHWRTGEVLMLGFMNREAWERTIAERRVWFYSRSRQELWLKGETSGNYQAVREVSLDCDGDAVLIKVDPSGPVCHTGAATCFHGPMARDDEGAAASDMAQRSLAAERGEAKSGTSVAGAERPASDVFKELLDVIRGRKARPSEGSYTADLFRQGREKICQKVGEEAIETVVAGLSQSDGRVISESADLIYHLFVLLAERNIALDDLSAELSWRRR